MKLRIIVILLIVVHQVHAGVIELKGQYHGQNLFVQNPLLPDRSGHCTQKVYLNGNLILSNPIGSSFMIDLSSLSDNAEVTVKIIHAGGCRPKVINARAIAPRSDFTFVNFTINSNGVLFHTQGEQAHSAYTIQKQIGGAWQSIRKIQSGANTYNVNITHSPGQNIYRIKYDGINGKVYYTKAKSYSSNGVAVKFYPKNVSNYIFFTTTADYEILNAAGKMIKKGRAKKVNVSSLPRGVYYLNLNQNTEKFLKK